MDRIPPTLAPILPTVDLVPLTVGCIPALEVGPIPTQLVDPTLIPAVGRILIPPVGHIPIPPVGRILIPPVGRTPTPVAVKIVPVLARPINYTPVPAVDIHTVNRSNIFTATKPTPIPVDLMHIPVAVGLILIMPTERTLTCRTRSIVHTLIVLMEDRQDTPNTRTSRQIHLCTEVIRRERERQRAADHLDSQAPAPSPARGIRVVIG